MLNAKDAASQNSEPEFAPMHALKEDPSAAIFEAAEAKKAPETISPASGNVSSSTARDSSAIFLTP